MKYIIFTFEGTGFPLAYRLLREGHEVEIGKVMEMETILTTKEKLAGCKEDKADRVFRMKVYNNIVPSIPAEELIEKIINVKDPHDYFIFFDSNSLFAYAEKLRGRGFHGYFPTQEDRLFEI